MQIPNIIEKETDCWPNKASNIKYTFLMMTYGSNNID